jgi:uncharacterized protein YjlB
MARAYEFVIHGHLDQEAIPALSGFTRVANGGELVLRGALASDQDLALVLGQFASLGLGLHAFRQLPDPEQDPQTSTEPR